VDTPLVEKQLKDNAGSYTKADMSRAYPIGRIATPKEIAHVICSVASPTNSFMTGSILMVDGGLTAK
jgi:NAD(P)-dependent dehydrogenase (short-subunit alcohol dehydrogenase family)